MAPSRIYGVRRRNLTRTPLVLRADRFLVQTLAILSLHRYLSAQCPFTILSWTNRKRIHAAVVLIADLDDGGSISLDRSSFAPGLTSPLTR